MMPQAAAEISATAGALLGAIEIGHEIAGASHELSAEKMAKGIANASGLIDYLSANMLDIEKAFERRFDGNQYLWAIGPKRRRYTAQSMACHGGRDQRAGIHAHDIALQIPSVHYGLIC
jgi:hypothetical protein